MAPRTPRRLPSPISLCPRQLPWVRLRRSYGRGDEDPGGEERLNGHAVPSGSTSFGRVARRIARSTAANRARALFARSWCAARPVKNSRTTALTVELHSAAWRRTAASTFSSTLRVIFFITSCAGPLRRDRYTEASQCPPQPLPSSTARRAPSRWPIRSFAAIATP
jgi:hypothetical protein